MDVLFPIASFAFVTTFTPGPNNILLFGSGLRFGFLRTIPHIVGIQFGVGTMLVLSALGFGLFLMSLPGAQLALRIIGTAYLLYLAWKMRRLAFNDDPEVKAKPFSFMQATLFQYLNPKAWMLTITGGSLFLPDLHSAWFSIFTLSAIFLCVGSISSCSWTVLGASIRHFLQNAFWQQAFSALMIVLTVYTAVSIWFV